MHYVLKNGLRFTNKFLEINILAGGVLVLHVPAKPMSGTAVYLPASITFVVPVPENFKILQGLLFPAAGADLLGA